VPAVYERPRPQIRRHVEHCELVRRPHSHDIRGTRLVAQNRSIGEHTVNHDLAARPFGDVAPRGRRGVGVKHHAHRREQCRLAGVRLADQRTRARKVETHVAGGPIATDMEPRQSKARAGARQWGTLLDSDLG